MRFEIYVKVHLTLICGEDTARNQWVPDIMERHVKRLTIIVKYNIYKCILNAILSSSY